MPHLRAYVVPFLLISCVSFILSCEKKNEVSDKEICKLSNDNRSFSDCESGSGIFGTWIVDSQGLPAYQYQLDQYADERAKYPNSVDDNRRDHYHLFGNDALNIWASNDGHIQVLDNSRGPTWYNKYDEKEKQYAGGWGYIKQDDNVWSTMYKFRPEQSETKRIFGIGYYQTDVIHDAIRVSRTSYAPTDNESFIISDITFQNMKDTSIQFEHFEYWDFDYHQIIFQLFRVGKTGLKGDRKRSQYNRNFDQTLSWNTEKKILRSSLTLTSTIGKPEKDTPSEANYYPKDTFVAQLIGDGELWSLEEEKFFGQGDIKNPEGIFINTVTSSIASKTAYPQSFCSVIRDKIALEPKQSITLRFAYGIVKHDSDLSIPQKYYQEKTDFFADIQNKRKEGLVYFSNENVPFMHREMAWHSAYINAAVTDVDYFGKLVTQGSAYLYSHGFDGAPRDFALYTLSVSYIRPQLAKEMLKVIMQMTKRDSGQIMYSYQGHGILEDAVIHKTPSDLDLFFLMALDEYLAATGDREFLNEKVSFYPKNDTFLPQHAQDETVLDHVKVALYHLIETVGLGEHKLVRVLDGDWNDAIVINAPDSANTIRNGESHPNTGMALYILPKIQKQLQNELSSQIHSDIDTFVQTISDSFKKEWLGKNDPSKPFYPRGYFYDKENKPRLSGNKEAHLESQIWPIISGFPEADNLKNLLSHIDTVIDSPSPIGAFLRKGEPDIWPAITGLLTWGYSLHDRSLAWRSMTRNTLHARAESMPNVWSNIWSATDGIHGVHSSHPGIAWSAESTPMKDFPVFNANMHTMAMLGMIRTLGIFSDANGLLFDYQKLHELNLGDTTLETFLFRLEYRKNSLHLNYHPTVDGEQNFTFVLPVNKKYTITVDDNSLFHVHDNQVHVVSKMQTRTPVDMKIEW